MRAIIIYASCEGQTERIAKRIANWMKEQGVPTDTFDVTRRHVHELAVESYDAVVLGSSLHYAQHDPRIAWCIHENRHLLKEIPTAFFSVSLGISSEHDQDRVEIKRLVSSFLKTEEFEPSRQACFAGALRYSRYGCMKKHLMHWIAKRSGNQTGTNSDYEYTDWNEVQAFAIDFANFIHCCRRAGSERPYLAGIRIPRREYSVRYCEPDPNEMRSGNGKFEAVVSRVHKQDTHAPKPTSIADGQPAAVKTCAIDPLRSCTTTQSAGEQESESTTKVRQD